MKAAWRLVVITALLIAGAATPSASDEVYPKPISSKFPMYPEQARTTHMAGTVKLLFVLDGNGAVTQTQAVSGNPMLRDAAVDIVKSWKFLPTSMHANVRYETEFVYDLDEQQKNREPKLTVSMTDFRKVEIVSELYVEPIP